MGEEGSVNSRWSYWYSRLVKGSEKEELTGDGS